MRNFLNKIRSPFWLGIIFSLIALIVLIIASNVLYNRTVTLLTQNLRERILTISITAAASIDAQDINALQVEEDWQKPEWSRVVNKLHNIKYSNKDIVFMYIFRKKADDPTQMQFVADADSIDPYANTSEDSSRHIDVNRDGIIEPDGPDKLQYPGQDYPEAADIPESFEAYNGALTSTDLYTDAYGTVLTGYAPIRDENGNTVAILATDIKADDFFTITRQTLQPFLLFAFFLVFIITVLTIVIVATWRKHARSLEKLNKQITIANARLKELDKQKTEFVSLASHQLRAPMTAISGYISLMLENDYGVVPDYLKDPIKRIQSSTKSLVQIVTDFLDITRIELGTMKYNLTDFDLADLVRQIAGELKPNIEASGLQFEIRIPEGSYPIHSDQVKLKQVFNNLIDNSLKYTKHGFVHVIVEKSDGKYLVKVEDSGVGIAKDTLPRLFEKFIRASNANEANVIGTGLGLYVAKQMVGKLGGRIWASSEGEGKGATFQVEIPAK